MLGVFSRGDVLFKHLYGEVSGGVKARDKLGSHAGIVYEKVAALKELVVNSSLFGASVTHWVEILRGIRYTGVGVAFHSLPAAGAD